MAHQWVGIFAAWKLPVTGSRKIKECFAADSCLQEASTAQQCRGFAGALQSCAMCYCARVQFSEIVPVALVSGQESVGPKPN